VHEVDRIDALDFLQDHLDEFIARRGRIDGR
jgi:hypothetical protein